MARERMPITPEVITWARERLGYKQSELAGKRREFKRIAEWESGASRPTYRQLELLAKDLWLPMAIFFFPEPPDLPPIEKTFRTLDSEQFAEIPPRMRLLMHKARAFQVGLAELNDGRNPADAIITRDLQFHDHEPLDSTAARIRDFIGVSLDEQFGWVKEDEALKAWRSAFFRVGVTVFKDAFAHEDYCGFSLYDDEFPIIYVNNSNSKTRQIFTLFHELAHLLYRTSGVDKHKAFRRELPAEYSHIEKQCNALAGAVLVPEEALENARRDVPANRDGAAKLAQRFNVSREVIYRKFLERGLIGKGEYESAKKEWDAQYGGRVGGGGNYYRTKIAYLGEEYISLVLRRYDEGRIEEEEMADYLATKLGNIDMLEETFFGERR